MSTKKLELAAVDLCRCTNPDELGFETTEELAPLRGVFGQDRAVRALEYGLAADSGGNHIYVAGPEGTGKMTAIHSVLAQVKSERPSPPSWCYVHNFEDTDRPVALSLPPSRASELVHDMRRFVEEGKVHIPRAFDTEDYAQRKAELVHGFEAQRDQMSRQVNENARRQGLSLEITPMGMMTVPLVENRNMTKEEFEALPEERRRELEQLGDQFKHEVEQVQRRVNQIEQETHDRIEEIDHQVALFAVGQLVDALCQKYGDLPEVIRYLEAVRKDVPEHVGDFRRPEREEPESIASLMREDRLLRYQVNPVVDNSHTHGAPVIVENQPTYYNLFGRIDYRARFGSMVTDFTMIKAGAMHRASGGYLVLHARDVLSNPLVWETLKRSLRSGEVRVENFAEQYTTVPTATIRPRAIPIDVKVVLVGPAYLYHLLDGLDEDFRALFAIRADFDVDVERSQANVAGYAGFVTGLVRREKLKVFHNSAIAKLVDFAARVAGHQGRLATRLAEVGQVVREAHFWANRREHHVVTGEDVDRAIVEREYRANLIEERLRRAVTEETVRITTGGAVNGQVNGLSVIDLGDFSFGRPVRITARCSLGSKGVVDIEREIQLSGRIHSKGVLILANYLAGKYAQDKPLALSASITFEQTYDEVDGDSASSAELYALLSSISGLPLRQDIAVTGSVNQQGEVQAIGGVNEKIEGFYRICAERGLSGHQGVIIPRDNQKHLMLKSEVVAAVREGKFHVWAVDRVEQGIELLTGVPAGAERNGAYPVGSVNFLVDQRLRAFAERMKDYRPLSADDAGVARERVAGKAAARLPFRRMRRSA